MEIASSFSVITHWKAAYDFSMFYQMFYRTHINCQKHTEASRPKCQRLLLKMVSLIVTVIDIYHGYDDIYLSVTVKNGSGCNFRFMLLESFIFLLFRFAVLVSSFVQIDCTSV